MIHGRWSEWVLKEKEAIEHIKYAYEQGINTFECAGPFRDDNQLTVF